MSTVPDQTIKRRDFLKVSGGMAAIGLFGGKTFTKVQGKTADPSSDEVTRYGWCRMCHRTYCPTVIKLKNGVVTNVEGDERCPWSEGTLCVRGNSSLFHLYNPYRVKTPLKRTNPEKGLDVDPGWVEISWDEALDTVAEKLRTIREDDPKKFVFFSGFGSDYTYLVRMFAPAFGTPNGLSVTGAMCSEHWPDQVMNGSTKHDFDPEYTNYAVVIGKTEGPNCGHGENTNKDYLRAVKRGMKTVVIDPRCSPEATKGEWVPIRPGTELALLLAMANAIVNEDKDYDVEFIKNRTNGPYLIGPDGYYLRDSESQKPFVWDAVDQTAKTFDDPTIADYALEGSYDIAGVKSVPAFQLLYDHLEQYTPEWAEPITTISAEQIRKITRELVAAAKIGSTVEIDGFTFPLRPAAVIAGGRGLTNHYDGELAGWTVHLVNILLGNMEVPGGCQAMNIGPYLKPDADGIVTTSKGHNPDVVWKFNYPPVRIDSPEFYPFGFSQGFRMVDNIVEPEKHHIKYKPEAMITFGVNLYTKAGDADRISEALRSIPFTTSIAYSLDEHSAFADIVLPESSMFERTLTATIIERKCWNEAKRYFGHLVQKPTVAPMYQTKQGDTILLELAEKVGILRGENGLNSMVNRGLVEPYLLDVDQIYQIDDIIDRMVKSKYGDSVGLDYFDDVGFITRERKLGEIYNYFHHPGNTTRHPIYNVLLKKAGDDLLRNLSDAGIPHPGWSEDTIRFYYQALPSWRPTPTFDPPPEFDLYGCVWKTAPLLFDISNTNGNPYLQEISSQDPYFGKLVINSKTAERKGLMDGDQVYVESQYGGKIGPYEVKLSETIHPDVVGVASGLSRSVFGTNPILTNGIPYNRLLSTKTESIDIITAAIDSGPRVRIYKA